jgi:hypothetical protein
VTGNPHVSLKYDEVEDITSVTLEDAWVTTNHGNIVKAEAAYTTPGREVTGPVGESIKISFTSHSALYIYRDSHVLSITADDMRFEYENTEWSGWLATTQDSGIFLYMEEVGVEIPGAEFRDIAGAERVQVKLGPTRFKISEKVLQAMRQMAGRIELPADS